MPMRFVEPLGDVPVRLRVLQVLPDFLGGGAERMVMNLVSAMDHRAFDVEVVGFISDGTDRIEKELAPSGVRGHSFDKGVGFDPRTFPRFDRLYARFRPHVVHTHLHVLRYVLPSIAMRRETKPVVHTIHNIAEREGDVFARLLQRLVFDRVVKPVASSNAVARTARRYYRLDGVTVIPNGIPLSQFRDAAGDPAARARWRDRHGFSPGDLLLACVGRLDPVKNHAALIEAFAVVAASLRSAHLVLAGDGQLRQRLGSLARRAGVGERVHFLGVRRDVAEVLAASDVFVMASDWEGGPLVAIEAMAAGLPVVATSVGWIPELVQNGRAGFVVQPGATADLAQRMLAVGRDGALRRRLSRDAAAAVSDLDSVRMAQRYEDLYRRLLRSSPDAPEADSTARLTGVQK